MFVRTRTSCGGNLLERGLFGEVPTELNISQKRNKGSVSFQPPVILFLAVRRKVGRTQNVLRLDAALPSGVKNYTHGTESNENSKITKKWAGII
jgi:hypothetical protein